MSFTPSSFQHLLRQDVAEPDEVGPLQFSRPLLARQSRYDFVRSCLLHELLQNRCLEEVVPEEFAPALLLFVLRTKR
jgi:hypothetical protein